MLLNKKIILCTTFILLGLGGWEINDYFRVKKLNILIVSTCSLRYSRLGYNGGVDTPNIDKLASKSYILENAITDMSWSNVSGFLSKLTNNDLKKYGYHAIGNPWDLGEEIWQQLRVNTPTYYFRTPASNRNTREQLTFYQDDLEEVKNRVLNKVNWPFLLDLHIKVMHLPYGGGFYKNTVKDLSGEEKVVSLEKKSIPVRYLVSPSAVKYIKDYEDKFEKYPARLPFSIFLGIRRKEFKKEVIKILNIDNSIAEKMNSQKMKYLHYIGILNNRKVLDRWRKSKFFEQDIKVIKEIYDARLKTYDDSLKDILAFYNNKDFEKNTVIIFTGDHGEAFYEHGYMIHGETVFDEMIRFPLFIKFPGQESGQRISAQFFQEGVSEVVEKIMNGELNQKNFKKVIENKIRRLYIYSRNCANDVRSLRYQNEWKLITDLKRDKRYLYDLVKDPGELVNVYRDNMHQATILEEKFPEIIELQSKNKMLHKCAAEV